MLTVAVRLILGVLAPTKVVLLSLSRSEGHWHEGCPYMLSVAEGLTSRAATHTVVVCASSFAIYGEGSTLHAYLGVGVGFHISDFPPCSRVPAWDAARRDSAVLGHLQRAEHLFILLL